MSKADQMRALRERRYAQRSSIAPRPVPQPASPSSPVSTPLPQPTEDRNTVTMTSTSGGPESTPAATDIAEPLTRVSIAGVRPALPAGKPIQAYKGADLQALFEWIIRDGRPRTMDELIEEGMKELGFVRKGKQIVSVFTEAIHAAGVTPAKSTAA